MPIFMIERSFADALELPLEAAADINLINDEEEVRWLYSFLSIDRRRSYCLYEAQSAEAIRAAATRAGIPADAVLEMTGRMQPDGTLTSV